jgi:hypothetical protein
VRVVGIWKPQFRMLYVYFSIYSFRIGMLNGRPEIGFMRTWKAWLRRGRV